MRASAPAESELARLAAEIADRIRAALLARPRIPGRGESLEQPDDLKSHHDVDRQAGALLHEAFAGHACNIFIEGEAPKEVPDAAFCVYVDPVDGSLNWDRGVGDPAFVLSVAPGPRVRTLDELTFSYVEGLRSGDRYRTCAGATIHRNALDGSETRLCIAAPERLAEATGYLRAGYGGARRQLARTLPLYLGARDLRAIDNAATEFGDIARNAAHFMVEARGLSDGFNLLAWPLVRNAGGVLQTLEGRDLPALPYDPAARIDFLLAGNRDLAQDVVSRMASFAAAGGEELDALLARY